LQFKEDYDIPHPYNRIYTKIFNERKAVQRRTARCLSNLSAWLKPSRRQCTLIGKERY